MPISNWLLVHTLFRYVYSPHSIVRQEKVWK